MVQFISKPSTNTSKKIEQSNIPPIPARLNNITNTIFKTSTHQQKKFYTQVFKENIKDVLKIKEAFLYLSDRKIINVANTVHRKEDKTKPRINMTTKEPSRKQVIVLMSSNYADLIIDQANGHIISINSLLKEPKSVISVYFIQADNRGIVITTNKVVDNSNLFIIKYFKIIDSVNINSPQLLQSKCYLKILEFSYITNKTKLLINSDIIEAVLKEILLFDNVVLALKSQIIKMFSKSDMAIVWVTIWNSQNGSKAKKHYQLTIQHWSTYLHSLEYKYKSKSTTIQELLAMRTFYPCLSILYVQVDQVQWLI